ncbi:MAG: glutathione S-transferase family protein [Wenzhouxiangellaceae bacterium]
MRLAYSPNSPYVRKVLICTDELGLLDQITCEAVQVSPTEPNSQFSQHGNPLSKIPALTLDDGRVLYDSGVICEYLDNLDGQQRLIPAGEQHWSVLTQHQLASGMVDALLLLRYEVALRPAERRWQQWVDGQQFKVRAALNYFEQQIELLHFEQHLQLHHIALGCALGYLDFRFADMPWRPDYPALAAWFEPLNQRPSFVRSAPPQ